MEVRGITSIQTLAQQAGMSDRSLYRKIKEKPGNFTLDDLGDVAQALGVKLSVLMGEAT